MSYSLGNSIMVSTPNSFGGLPIDNRMNCRLNENNNDHMMMNGNDKIQEIWNQHIFKPEKVEQALNQNNIKVSSWINENISEHQEDLVQEKIIEVQEIEDEPSVGRVEESAKEEQNGSPSHHARRPMNAFLIFCKKHRPIVRERFPNLENRGVTKILGEWWSLLEEGDKTPFTNLANEYKDAFLTANPDFKWYKLPAPPLRTLTVRPPQIFTKLPSPQSSPSHANLQNFNEFNPGKLADESQLGSLTTLMNNNFSSAITKLTDCCENRKTPSESPMFELGENNNKLELCDTSLQSPVNLIKAAVLPPKPIKKRIFQQFSESNTKEVSRNIVVTEDNENSNSPQSEHQKKQENMTNQDIVNKVVDKMLIDDAADFNKSDLERENTRKSGRQCKGKRYEKFMVEGKLLGNKKEPKLTQHKISDTSNPEKPMSERKPEIVTPNLENTIRRLAERTKLSVIQNEENEVLHLSTKDDKEERCGSETSEPCSGSNFNLDLKIGNLPCLSYEAFVQRKRESKKKKLRKVSSENLRNGEKRVKKAEPLVGSKKRKNKHSITHLEKKQKTDFISDLAGLATLAEVAANTQKINET
ncbi:HMG box transcription factor BBX [Coccinella septempunctata]|uniref:HMG box transcription factor BBX n=1 Tax=Coccinella septempunctata TaxID=41139 RepID=UPI001D06F646|nr:HMG box transcription factor BBX [Coccinella septempunctata]